MTTVSPASAPWTSHAFGFLRPAGLVESGRQGHDGGGIAVSGGSAQYRVGSFAVAFVVQALGIELHRNRFAGLRGPPRPLRPPRRV